MKKATLLLFLLVCLFTPQIYACSPFGTPFLASQNISGGNLNLVWTNTTGWACCYQVKMELICNNQNFTGNSNYNGPTINKPNANNMNYPTWSIPLSGLCPGVTYKFRARDCWCNSNTCSPWSQTYTVTIPGSLNPLSVNITPANPSVCVPGNVTLTATPTGGCGPFTYSWSPGGQTSPSITVAPNVNTTYTVTVNDICSGQQATQSVLVTVLPPPVAGTASVTPNPVCAGDPVTLTLTGSAGNVQWQQSTNGGGTWSNIPGATNTTHTTGPLSVNICFRAEVTGCGPTVYSNMVCVTVNPVPTLNVNNATICAGQSATLTANPNLGGGTYLWTPGGQTTQSITVSPGSTTTYTVDYTLNGCTGTATGTVTVNPLPIVNFSIVPACDGFPIVLTDMSSVNPGTITGWQWNYGDGSPFGNSQNTTHTYSGPGTYTITLVVTTNAGCVDSLSQQVTVFPNPTANFSATTVCNGLATQFTDLSNPNPTSWQWYFGDGNTSNAQSPAHTYANPGTYNVKLVIAAGTCYDSIVVPVTVHPMPQPGFTMLAACPTQPSAFNNTSTISSGTMTYQWSFPGATPSSSTQTNPANIVYPTGGTYNVTLVVTSNNGCVDSITQQIIIPYTPVANFTLTDVCAGTVTCFTDMSSVQNGNITGWQWVFGDGSPIDFSQNPCHVYAIPGAYIVTLVVTSNDGCSGSFTQTITIHPNPIASFNVSNVCRDFAAQFNNTSQGASVYDWDFGNTVTSNVFAPVYQYPAPGNYIVQLIVTTGFGCADTTSQPLTIYPEPVADFNFTNVCHGTATSFNDASSIGGGGSIQNWNWSSGGGFSSQQQNPTYTYPNPGVYNVQLVVTSADGCVDTIVKTINVFALPVVDFTPVDVCIGTPNVFTDLTTVQGGTPAVWNWNFGNGSYSSQQNPTHTYQQIGSFNVTLIVTTNNGCVDSTTKTVNVHPYPVVDFVADTLKGCSPLCVNLTNLSTISQGSIAQYLWDMGDGTTASQFNLSNCYTNNSQLPREITISLTATSGFGCATKVTKQNYLTVFPNPVAKFEMDPSTTDIFNSQIKFFDLSIGPTYWNWSFGDGNGDVVKNPVHVYQDTGSYLVTLQVTNKYGCTDIAKELIRINPNFAIYIPNTFTVDGDGKNDLFFAKGFGIKEYHIMIFDRWGELIYEGFDFENSKWDGNVKGRPAKVDVYVYKVIVKDVFDKKHSYIGHVNLIK